MTYIWLILGVAGLLYILEQLRPATSLPQSKHWYLRAFVFNSLQSFVAFLGTALWDKWFAQIPLLHLNEFSLLFQVIVGYFLITFIYYWWHRVRHTSSFLWRYLHQFHHSPTRIEVITSFYKSPIELIANSLLSSAILYFFLGLSVEAVALTVLLTALAELIYHMNINTPHAMGYIFQRPQMHRIHHERGKHHYNYADLPLWDMLFGTYSNPKEVDIEIGFPEENELKIKALLTGKKLKI